MNFSILFGEWRRAESRAVLNHSVIERFTASTNILFHALLQCHHTLQMYFTYGMTVFGMQPEEFFCLCQLEIQPLLTLHLLAWNRVREMSFGKLTRIMKKWYEVVHMRKINLPNNWANWAFLDHPVTGNDLCSKWLIASVNNNKSSAVAQFQKFQQVWAECLVLSDRSALWQISFVSKHCADPGLQCSHVQHDAAFGWASACSSKGILIDGTESLLS